MIRLPSLLDREWRDWSTSFACGHHRAAMRVYCRQDGASKCEGADFLRPVIGRSLFSKDKKRSSISRGVAANYAAPVIILSASAVSIVTAPDMRGLFGAILALLMGVIAMSDLRHFTVPNVATAPAFVLALVYSVVRDPVSVIEPMAHATLRALVLALMFLLLREIHRRLRGREGIGLGDVKLAGVAGAWLDWLTIPLAVEVAALAALAAYALRKIATGRPLRPQNRVPFGLFFAPAIWIGWLFEVVTSEMS
jgi:leader peptidase (prepilin peptidase)/N-methyltransferase